MTHGCYNRAPLRESAQVQTGWQECGLSRIPIMEWIPDPLTKECQYTISNPEDPKCVGCKWKRGMKKVLFIDGTDVQVNEVDDLRPFYLLQKKNGEVHQYEIYSFRTTENRNYPVYKTVRSGFFPPRMMAEEINRHPDLYWELR